MGRSLMKARFWLPSVVQVPSIRAISLSKKGANSQEKKEEEQVEDEDEAEEAEGEEDDVMKACLARQVVFDRQSTGNRGHAG